MYASSANNLTTPYEAGSGIDVTNNIISSTNQGWLRTNGALPTSISNNLYTNGNIAIGHTNPNFPLDVQGTFGERIRTYSTDGYYAGLLAKNNTREFFVGIQANFETNNSSSGFHIYDNTSGAQRMVIDKDGNMGINNPNPTAKLQVNGTVRITDGTQGDGKVLTSGSDGTASWTTLVDNVDDADADPTNEYNTSVALNDTNLAITDAGSTITTDLSDLQDSDWLKVDGMVSTAINEDIYTNGKVGIGTTSINDLVHLYSGGNGTRIRAENSGNGWAGMVAKNTQREIFVGIQGAFDANPGEFHIYDNTAGARRLVIDAAGEIGIGRNNPSVKLDVNGSVNCTGGTCSSDVRWKRDITTLDNTLVNISKLRGVSYFWRNSEFPNRDFDKDKQIGVIAQEVEKVYPELIHTDNEGFKSMDYMSLSAVLLEATKQQQIILEKQQEEIDMLKNKVSEYDSLRAEIDLIKNSIKLKE